MCRQRNERNELDMLRLKAHHQVCSSSGVTFVPLTLSRLCTRVLSLSLAQPPLSRCSFVSLFVCSFSVDPPPPHTCPLSRCSFVSIPPPPPYCVTLHPTSSPLFEYLPGLAVHTLYTPCTPAKSAQGAGSGALGKGE